MPKGGVWSFKESVSFKLLATFMDVITVSIAFVERCICLLASFASLRINCTSGGRKKHCPTLSQVLNLPFTIFNY